MRWRSSSIGSAALLAAALLLCPAQAEESHRGGTLRLLAHAAAGSIDPQVNDTAQFGQLFLLAYDGLVTLRKVAGKAGQQVVPDLAASPPTIEEDGRRYTFTLRHGLRFSDGRPVRPEDAAASFRRMLALPGPGRALFGAISDVSADDALWTVTIRLSQPDPDLLLKLALPVASIVPADAPRQDVGLHPLPGTGPYRIQHYDPGSVLRLVRNPFFRVWNAAAQPDGYPDAIAEHFGLDDEAEVTEVERGQADWLFDTPPMDRLAELGTRYAAQVHLDPAFALWFLTLNVHMAPFNDVWARRAVAMAVDRAAAVKLFGGPRLATATCAALPPGLTAETPSCPAPDLAAARALVAQSGTAGQRVTLVIDDSAVMRAIGTAVLSVLRDLGYDARLRVLSGNIQYTYIQNSANRVQIALATWYADYPSPADFLGSLFGCTAFHPGSDASTNMAGFCDPALDALIAARRWRAAVALVAEQAPAAILFAPRYIDVTSRRIGHFVYHEQFHWLLDQAWVR